MICLVFLIPSSMSQWRPWMLTMWFLELQYNKKMLELPRMEMSQIMVMCWDERILTNSWNQTEEHISRYETTIKNKQSVVSWSPWVTKSSGRTIRKQRFVNLISVKFDCRLFRVIKINLQIKRFVHRYPYIIDVHSIMLNIHINGTKTIGISSKVQTTWAPRY